MDWKPSGVHPRLWVRVVQSLIFYVVFCSLVFCRPFFFLFVWNCIVVLRRCTASELYCCPSSMYGFRIVLLSFVDVRLQNCIVVLRRCTASECYYIEYNHKNDHINHVQGGICFKDILHTVQVKGHWFPGWLAHKIDIK
jgi:hypothetical protein